MVRARYLDNCISHFPEGDWDGYRIGSEGCHHLLPGSEQIKILSESLDPEKLSLITPIVGPGHDTNVLEVAETALKLGWGEVVVNDWGVLEQIGQTGASRIAAGRLLMRFRRGPGEVDRWEDLDETSRKYFAWGPLYDSGFLGFLRDMGVIRLELDPPRHWLSLPETDGFSLSMHLEERFITLSAACPWLYDENTGSWQSEEECGKRCLSGDLGMSSDRLDQPLILRNKAILEKVEEPVDIENLPRSVDRLIFANVIPEITTLS